MKKFISLLPFVLGISLGLYTMFLSITGRLHTSAAAEITVFSLGFMITAFCSYAAYMTAKEC